MDAQACSTFAGYTDESIVKGVAERSHDLPWYVGSVALENLHPKILHILTDCSGLSLDEIVPHVNAIRDKAFDVFPYPCIGGFRFLDPSIVSVLNYAAVVSRLKAGGKFLDLGCCFGQDIRILVADGVPAENLYGADLNPKFIELGYELFRDKDKLASKFYAADVFDPASPLVALKEQLDVVHIGSFLHLFSWDDCVRAGVAIVGLLKKESGVLVVGRQAGAENSGEWSLSTRRSDTKYRHNAASFERLWKEIGEKTGSAWKVTTEFGDWSDGAVKAKAMDRSTWVEGKQVVRFRFVVERE